MSTSIITQAIEWALDQFKAKNGFVWAIIMAILALIHFALQYITGHPELGIVFTPAIQSIINSALIVLAGLIGGHTTTAQKRAALKKESPPYKIK